MNKENSKKEEKATASIQASGFPLSAFREWNESCEKDFGNCRWVKMMHDHQVSKMLPLLNSMTSRIEQLESHMTDLATPHVQNEGVNEVKTIGGEKK